MKRWIKQKVLEFEFWLRQEKQFTNGDALLSFVLLLGVVYCIL